ncbi:MAG: amino-acid N-acetyltransferase [Chromatiales bacterium]|jgi:amino-acid N-acetyltransferase|nr:amino-acid N-acetyltransferase [Chromatiales bacterium]
MENGKHFVTGFRASAPYIHAFRGQTFVIVFGGEIIAEQRFVELAHDIALLHSLGIRLVLVHGSRPQIEQRLHARGGENQYLGGLRVTDEEALACVKEAAGTVSMEIAALLSMGLANTPMAGARIRVGSGNFVTAKPLGIIDGIDYRYTGTVRRIDAPGIKQQLDAGAIVLLSPVGYSPTGEVFNLSAQEVAAAAAAALDARKYICLVEASGIENGDGQLLRELALSDAEALLANNATLALALREGVRHALDACRGGVRRAHLVDQRLDGALLLELFTRDGIGTMITTDLYQETRQARIDDVGGILTLIAPLEADGTLVRRSREHLEIDIEQFTVVERDGTIIACAALHPFAEERIGELACLAVHPDYRHNGYGDALLKRIAIDAAKKELSQLFVLTTHAAHWFRERGFIEAGISDLPVKRQQIYNYQRNSKALIKQL